MAEQRWVTINGHHVLINDDGTPVNEKDKKFLASENKQVQKKAWKDMTHQERVAEMQKDGERYAKDPTIADKEKWSADYKREVIDYARPIMAEKRRSATIKSPGKQTKKQRLEAARQEVENAKNKVTTDRGLKKPGKTVSLEEKKEYLRKNNLAKFAKELNSEGNNTEAAINYVYDQNTLSKEDFAKKYGISEATNKTKSAVIKNPGSKNKSLRKNASRKTISTMETKDLEKTYREGVKNGTYKRPSEQMKYDSTEYRILNELGHRGREYNEHMGKFVKGKSTGRGHVRKYNR